MVGMAEVAVLVHPCPAGSRLVEVQARAVLGAIEAADQIADLVSMADSLEGGVASANMTLYSLMGRCAFVCISESLKTTSTRGTICQFLRSQSWYPKLLSGP